MSAICRSDEPASISSRESGAAKWLPRLMVLLSLLVTIVAHLPYRNYPIGRDQGVWLAAAMAIQDGKCFFKDFLHFNLPGNAFAYFFAWSFVDHPAAAMCLLAILNSILMIGVIYLLVAETYSRPAAACAAFAYGVIWPTLPAWWDVNQKGLLAFPWMMLATYCAARAIRGRRFYKTSLLASGLCVGLAAHFKPIFVLVGLLIAIALAIRCMTRSAADPPETTIRTRLKSLCRELGLAICGGMLSFLPLFVYLAVGGALTDAWESTSRAAVFYASSLRSDPGSVWLSLAVILVGHFPLLMSTSFLAGLVFLVASKSRPQRFWLLIPLVAALACYFIQGRGWFYHLLPFMVMVLVFGGVFMAWPWESRHLAPLKRGSLSRIVLCVVFSIPTLHMIYASYTSSRYAQVEVPAWRGQLSRTEYLEQHYAHDKGYPNPAVSESLADWLRQRTTPDDTILVWGLECQVYALARRRYATQAPFDFMLTSEAVSRGAPDWQNKQRRRFIELLRSDKPKFFVVTTRDVNSVEKVASDEALELIPGLSEYLREEYTLATTIERFKVLQRREATRRPQRPAAPGHEQQDADQTAR